MNAVYAALREVASVLKRKKLRYAVIGAVAAAWRGQPRTTNDVDLSVWVELGEEQTVIKALLTEFRGRIPDAAEFAIENRVLLLQAKNGVGIDVTFASFPFEEAMIQRASLEKLSARLSVPVITAEDSIVMKALSGRPMDWFDIQGIYDRGGAGIDHPAVLDRLSALRELIESDDLFARLEEIHRQANADDL